MNNRVRQCILMVRLIMEQNCPHIVSSEMDLNEVLVVDIVQRTGITFNYFLGNS